MGHDMWILDNALQELIHLETRRYILILKVGVWLLGFYILEIMKDEDSKIETYKTIWGEIGHLEN